MKKLENGRYPVEFRKWAVEQMKGCDNIAALAKRIGVSQVLLYRWRKDPVHPDAKKQPPGIAAKPPRELTPYEELQQVKQALAEKVLELDFVKGALQRVEARRQKSASSGETTSTRKSGK